MREVTGSAIEIISSLEPASRVVLEAVKVEGAMRLKTLIAILSAVFLATLSQAVAQEEEQETDEFAGHFHDPTDIWAMARGGQLYDNWMSVIEQEPPEGNHPAYPAEAKKSGASTWRCKECHGWDYMGAAGAYASGSHHTGIKGVRGVEGMDVEAIHQIIMDDTHGFTEETMPHSAMEKLALFLNQGQIDMDRYIDRESKVVRGSPRRGAASYQTICTVCHGFRRQSHQLQGRGEARVRGHRLFQESVGGVPQDPLRPTRRRHDCDDCARHRGASGPAVLLPDSASGIAR